jgi:hypothetical protein
MDVLLKELVFSSFVYFLLFYWFFKRSVFFDKTYRDILPKLNSI